MMTSKPSTGDVWRYPYLWKWQAKLGETGGRKQRPTVMAAVVPIRQKHTNLYLIPITSQEPEPDRDALELPATEIRRAGLSEFKRLWIIFDEHNLDILEQSFSFDPNAQVGTFSKAFVKVMAKRFMAAYQNAQGQSGVDRTE